MKDLKFIGIYGPTATGKTQLALSLAKKYPIEIISVDSALVFKDMDIGTAKPSKDEQASVPHHLIDIICPNETYTVGQFCLDSEILIKEILSRGKIPLLVGGTGLYFEALLKGYTHLPVISDADHQKAINMMAEKGLKGAHQYLLDVDSRFCGINENDRQRIHRALSIYLSKGEIIYDYWDKQTTGQNGTILTIRPTCRETLKGRINQRLGKMLDAGLIDETKMLIKKYNLNQDHNSMRAVGYRQVYEHLVSRESIDQLRLKIYHATCQYAKRQTTWLNRCQSSTYFESCDEKALKNLELLLGNFPKT